MLDKLEIIFGSIIAIVWFLICLTIKAIFVVSGLVIVPIAVTYSYHRRLPVLPWIFWPWRNLEEAYTSKGPNCKDIINEPGNWHWVRKVQWDGWSQLKFFIYWTAIRNSSHGIQKTYLCANLEKLNKVLFNYCTLTKLDGMPSKAGTVKHWWSPWPDRVRAALGENGRYWDISLTRCGFMYYFIIRTVKVYPEKEYFKRTWYKPWEKTSLGLQKKHREVIVGCKQYWYRVFFTYTDHPDKPLPPYSKVGQTINYAYRIDNDWA